MNAATKQLYQFVFILDNDGEYVTTVYAKAYSAPAAFNRAVEISNTMKYVYDSMRIQSSCEIDS